MGGDALSLHSSQRRIPSFPSFSSLILSIFSKLWKQWNWGDRRDFNFPVGIPKPLTFVCFSGGENNFGKVIFLQCRGCLSVRNHSKSVNLKHVWLISCLADQRFLLLMIKKQSGSSCFLFKITVLHLCPPSQM